MQGKVWKTVLIGKTGFWPLHPGGDPSQTPFLPMTTGWPFSQGYNHGFLQLFQSRRQAWMGSGLQLFAKRDLL